MNAFILQFKRVTTLCLIVSALGCFAILPIPKAFGVLPAPDGGFLLGLRLYWPRQAADSAWYPPPIARVK